MTIEKYSLPFDAKFQSGLLYLLITDYDFLRSVIDDLEPGHFDAGESHIKLFKLVKKVFTASKKPITMGIINNYILKLQEGKFYSEGDVFGLHAVIDAGNSLIPVELAYVKDNCIDFLKKQSMAIAFSKALDSFEKADYDGLYSQIGEAYKKSYSIGTDFGLDYSKQLVTDRYSTPPRSGIWSTGFPMFDSYIGGGFAKRESHSFISATGRGKTALLCNLAVSALRQRKKTLFITLEMSKEQIAQRFDSIISGFSAGELATMPEARIELQRNLNQRLNGLSPVIKEFNRGQLSINGLRNYLDKYTMEYGNPEVIILDWLGCMKMPTGIDKKHEAVGQVADEVINMSREYNCTIINAQQSNRSAVGNDSFGYDSVSSSFESLFGQDGVYTLGASDKAKDAGRRTLTIAKNRNGPDSVFVSLQGDLPTKPLTFKFRECILEEEESTLLKEPGSSYKKKENKD